MAARRGLNKGRGLESLIPQKIKTEEQETEDKEKKTSDAVTEVKKNRSATDKKEKTAVKTTEAGKKSEAENKDGVISLRISQVVPNHEQPRKNFDEEAIAELSESISQYGVLQPLLVQKKGRYYEIIAGERRWRAAKKAGLKEIPVLVRQYTNQETMEISLIENIQREDLNAIEEAEAYQSLINDFHLTQEEVAKRVGKGRASVANTLRLLNLSEPVREMLVNGEISMGHARALLSIEDETQQTEAAREIIQRNLSVRETEKLVKQLLHPRNRKEKEQPDEQTQLAYKAIEDRISKKLGSKTSIYPKGNKGKIEINYYSQEDLERILELIG